MNTSERFKNKHVLITGGARGIGFAVAKHFAREGAIISILDFSRELLDRSMKELARITQEVYPYHVDVSQRLAVNDAVSAAENIQPVDILINNVGVAFETPFLHIEESEWKKVLDINLSGMFYVAQSVCRFMAGRKKGVVVNMAS
ncbi:MAG TPA: SDR family NAD(P)-dependent oxidoreductase, partial [Puia sp.]